MIENLLDEPTDPIADYYHATRECLYNGLSFEFKAGVDAYMGLYLDISKDGVEKKFLINKSRDLIDVCVTLIDSSTNLISTDQFYRSVSERTVETKFVRQGPLRPVVYFNKKYTPDLIYVSIKSGDHVIFEPDNKSEFSHYIDDLISPQGVKFTDEDIIAIIKNQSISIDIKVQKIEETTRESLQ